MKTFISTLIFFFVLASFAVDKNMVITHSQTIDSLGACQGISNQNGRIFLYGDREVGMIREYKLEGDSLKYLNKEMRLTLNDTDVINHPTGIAYQDKMPVFIGNSIRLNKEGNLWRAVIYCIDWDGLQRTNKLDGNLINTIDDDACVQGTRPEYVQYKNKWYVATADYGEKANEVRLYNSSALKYAKRTTEKGVLFKKFNCTPWVQNLFGMADKGILVLIQNKTAGKQWRFTYVDLEKSIESGKEFIIKVVDINERVDELEGFAFLNNKYTSGIAVTSSQKNNVNLMGVNW
ncbi:MAG: hypothetical protein K2Q21_15125 [Chitinophagaceae bacterium]|nr:hypothetical protein [Chitinophagaceae bacterium]